MGLTQPIASTTTLPRPPRRPTREPSSARTGLVYFWVLNDHCSLDELRRQLREFARANVAAVVLHPRSGLLVPYGGTDWFDLIRILVTDCVALGVEPWLYDEDPYPSGSCGGRLPLENPELQARVIHRYESNVAEGGLFLFPTGKLLWAGAVPPEGVAAAPIDLTARVGMIRRHWEVSPWDSRYYYPATPRYQCPRSDAHLPEFALRVPSLPTGWRTVAFVARPVEATPWGCIADSLNPAATKLFIEMTHERYAASLGDMLGRDVPAIFTDEPKAHSHFPWTPGMFESFREHFGYDLQPRLNDLFCAEAGERSMLTRVHYRHWCTERFLESWLKPIRHWCDQHGLKLIGHMSPEDDPVEQVLTIGNYFPMQKHLTLAGLDLIVPAVGDADHPMLNIGVTSAISAAQQMNKPGVMSETLGASGTDITTAAAAKVLAWQTMCGVGTIVVHAAFASTAGLRRYDAPPNFGPNGSRWKGLCHTQEWLRPFQQTINAPDVSQVAPAAILWPIRSFQAEVGQWLHEDTGPRREINQLLLACLQAQVGVHILDEEHFLAAERDGAELKLGRAAYRAILLPSMSIIGQATLRRLAELKRAGIPIYRFGDAPRFEQHQDSLCPVDDFDFDPVPASDWTAWCRQILPRLLELRGTADLRHVRVTGWTAGGETAWMVMNLLDRPQTVELDGRTILLAAGQLIELRHEQGGFRVPHRFNPADVPAATATDSDGELTRWQIRWSNEEAWQPIERPLAAYQLMNRVPLGAQTFTFPLTGPAAYDGHAVAPQLEYRATLTVPATARDVTMILEPTAVRGRVTVIVNGREWEQAISDIDPLDTTIELSGVAPPGEHEVIFRVLEPMALDGIKVSPIVRCS